LSFFEALCHLFRPMVDDPFWLVLLRWVVTLTVMLTTGMSVVLAEASMLDRIIRHWDRRLPLAGAGGYRQQIRHHFAPRRVTFTTMFD
jgi:hypothetical protein